MPKGSENGEIYRFRSPRVTLKVINSRKDMTMMQACSQREG